MRPGWALRDGKAARRKGVRVAGNFRRWRLEELPEAPGYKLFNPPIGQGAYGKVWLAREPAGQWKALKAVYLKNFEPQAGPI